VFRLKQAAGWVFVRNLLVIWGFGLVSTSVEMQLGMGLVPALVVVLSTGGGAAWFTVRLSRTWIAHTDEGDTPPAGRRVLREARGLRPPPIGRKALSDEPEEGSTG